VKRHRVISSLRNQHIATMNKLLWVATAAAVALLIVYFTMPWLIGKAAALLVALVGAMTGLFLRKKRGT